VPRARQICWRMGWRPALRCGGPLFRTEMSA
jgi:hypothetical protein